MGKGRYLLKRLVYIVFVFFIISILMFAIYKSMPGNPVDIMLGDSKTTMKPDAYQALYDKTVANLGLDKPLPIQYLAWMGNMLTGNFGYSTQYKQAVINIIGERLVGFDVNEVCPPADPSGITSILAARLINEALAVHAKHL